MICISAKLIKKRLERESSSCTRLALTSTQPVITDNSTRREHPNWDATSVALDNENLQRSNECNTCIVRVREGTVGNTSALTEIGELKSVKGQNRRDR